MLILIPSTKHEIFLKLRSLKYYPWKRNKFMKSEWTLKVVLMTDFLAMSITCLLLCTVLISPFRLISLMGIVWRITGGIYFEIPCPV